MSAREVLSCDHCHADLKPSTRRFVASFVLAGINGEDKHATFYGDCCSAECLMAATNDLVRNVS